MEKTPEAALVENLLVMAKACAKARQIQLSTVSRLSHGDVPALDNLARGKGSITLRKYTDTMQWLEDPLNWPAGTVPPELPWAIVANGKPKKR